MPPCLKKVARKVRVVVGLSKQIRDGFPFKKYLDGSPIEIEKPSLNSSQYEKQTQKLKSIVNVPGAGLAQLMTFPKSLIVPARSEVK